MVYVVGRGTWYNIGSKSKPAGSAMRRRYATRQWFTNAPLVANPACHSVSPSAFEQRTLADSGLANAVHRHWTDIKAASWLGSLQHSYHLTVVWCRRGTGWRVCVEATIVGNNSHNSMQGFEADI